ncbi:hypothetical protein QCN29_11625 [Streptomyces sp. HNM0663]|uniref:Uncharacterized protein n=1 Tax=Streptomyces chengmaiensis TaxID=3040919 RepID=A0ABT6HMB9_9ACTN|nr:hypothetical protein [Streptomyces chengmaiensis]MDH2389432.1 hypothetical protein [Streptomyces chengmaiensis]
MTVFGPLPVHLLPPNTVPEPAPGCGVCAALAEQHGRALARGDRAKATRCSAEIRNHPHTQEADA